MAVIAVNPIILTNCKLTITLPGETPTSNDYEKHVSRVQFDPSTQTQTWKGLSPTSSFTKTSRATWTATLEYAQDWETDDSLSQLLHDHEGETVAAVFQPESGGASWAANLVITPGAIGGTVDQFATASVTLGVSGKPVRTPAA